MALAIAGTTTAVIGAIAITTSAGSAGQPDHGGDERHEVPICHATGSRTNPYVRITVDDDAIVKQGHGAHGGALFSADLADHEKWGDVVPPFDFGEGARFGGLNWSAAGQALLMQDCGGRGDAEPEGPKPPGSKPDHPTTRPKPETPGPEPEHPGPKPEHPGPKPEHPGTGPDHPGVPTTAGPTTAAPTTVAVVKGVSETAPPMASASGTLPVTGTRAGLVAAVGALLLAIGIALLVLRRRQLT